MHADHLHKALGLSAVILLLVAGLALGAQPASSADPLAGPAVKTEPLPPGSAGSFGEMRREGKHPTREIPHGMFMRAINEVLGPTGEESLRLSSEQRRRITDISEAFVARQRQYMREHGQELADLRQAVGGESKPAQNKPNPPAGPESGQGPIADTLVDMQKQSLNKAQRAEVLEKAKRLREGAPQPEEARAAIWKELTAPQRAAVQAKLDATKEDLMRKAAEHHTHRQVQNRQAGGGKIPKDPGKPKGAPSSEPAEVKTP